MSVWLRIGWPFNTISSQTCNFNEFIQEKSCSIFKSEPKLRIVTSEDSSGLRLSLRSLAKLKLELFHKSLMLFPVSARCNVGVRETVLGSLCNVESENQPTRFQSFNHTNLRRDSCLILNIRCPSLHHLGLHKQLTTGRASTGCA